MDGSAVSSLAGVRALPGASGRQLCERSEELSVAGAQRETSHQEGPLFLLTP